MSDFDDIVSGLDLDETTDLPVPVSELSDLELAHRYDEVKRELRRTAQMFSDMPDGPPSTKDGRDLHSQRLALLVELRRRKNK